MDPHPISRAGYDKIREEIRVLEEDQLPAVTERIKLARDEGDLKENAEYHAAREQQGYIQAKVSQLKTKLANCRIVEKSDMPRGVVNFGSLVTVRDLSDGEVEQYELVGPGEEDYDGDVMKILTSSPIAQAMLGKKVGDKFETEVPVGTLNFEITAIGDADD
ncbi:MAG: transcription elongation factor GreA [Fuerstiella sp.]|nr:transcription elongation factor GreA [Fuerstiella sp.]